MKQRRPTRRKPFRQPPKRYPPSQDPVGTAEGPLTLREPADQAALKGEGGLRADATEVRGPFHLSMSLDPGSYELQGGATKPVIERRLSEQPDAIRDTARALSGEFKSQANELKQQRPNDKDRIAQRDVLLVLTENMATGLASLADNLDQAIRKGSKDKPEPVFLGKAAEVVQRLHFGLMGWLKENRTAVFDVSYRVGIFLLGAVLLYSVGADSMAAVGGLAHILKSPLSKKKGRKK